MFSKLLKHELKSQGGLIGFLSLGALGVGVFGGLLLWLLMNLTKSNMDAPIVAIGSIFSFMALAGTIFAIMAYMIGIRILLIYRFYKHHFSDEGYLTFTLPASTHQILLSSILNIAIWILVSGIVEFISIALILSPVMIPSIQQASEYYFSIEGLMYELSGGTVFLQILSVISIFVYSLILPLLSITIGAQVAKKHKLLAAFGIGYGLSAAIGIVSGIISIFSLIGDAAVSVSSDTIYFVFSLLIPSLLYLAIGIGGYFIMHHLVDKKLNLP